QLVIVENLARDYYPDVQVKGCSLIREKDHVALSSRNVYLSDHERHQARNIYVHLDKVAQSLKEGNSIQDELANAYASLRDAGLEPQYFEFVDRNTLRPVSSIQPGEYLLCAAVMCGTTRLIDN